MTTTLPWAAEPSPVLPHLASEFLLWMWWIAERDSGSIDLGDELGRIDFWVDTRIAFRFPTEAKTVALLTGENPSAALEARAAVVGGKIPQELRFGFRREEDEFFVTLRAPSLDLVNIALPQTVKGGGEEALYDRMYLFDRLVRMIKACFTLFASQRSSTEWSESILPAMKAWINEGVGGPAGEDA